MQPAAPPAPVIHASLSRPSPRAPLSLQLNPWASGAEWNGPFSDSDKVRWTRRLKQRLGYEPDAGGEKTDGLFWMQVRHG